MNIELDLALEEWRTIQDHPEYMISNYGRVKHLGNNKTRKEKILNPAPTGAGYLHLALCENGQRDDKLVHRLVAEAFVPNPEGLPEVNHINEVKDDNRAVNLCWVSHIVNCNYGSRNERLQKRQERKAVRCVETGEIFTSIRQAALSVGREAPSLSMCVHGKTETCGGYHWVLIEK